MKREFNVIPVDDMIAVGGAQLKHSTRIQTGEDIPMADSLIDATTIVHRAVCITPPLDKIPRLKRRWIR